MIFSIAFDISHQHAAIHKFSTCNTDDCLISTSFSYCLLVNIATVPTLQELLNQQFDMLVEKLTRLVFHGIEAGN